MKRQALIILLIPTVVLFFAAAITVAEEYGNIEGIITDSQTGQPIVGATVLLVGTNRGAQTDADGKFIIKRVPPGTYIVKISAVGFQELELKSIRVKSDLTVKVINSLTQRTEEIEEKIVVEAEADILDKFNTSNQTVITKETTPRKPDLSVDELKNQAGGVNRSTADKSRVKGGRASEAQYYSGKDVPGSTPYYVPQHQKGRRVIQDSYTPPHRPYYEETPYFDDMFFQNYGTNGFIDTRYDYQSTFAIDIDDASYTLTRSYLERSALPPADAIRVEEFINHFEYNYRPPKNETFSVYLEGAPSRFGDRSQLLRVGIKGKMLDVEERRPSNIVFVVDGSGSMAEGGRYMIVNETLRHIISGAQRDDQIGIVAYNQTAEVIIESTSAREREKLLEALNWLFTNGSTNVQAGLHLGFIMAARNFDSEKNNCVILFSDGVANVGITDAERLLDEIKKYSKKGITLSTIGVGMGNYNDVLLEKLGDKGNGFYAYVDSFEEACKVFDKSLTGSLQTIARDVKIQVEFDPDIVQSYRLLGYENRAVADYHFRNDKVDGGEVTPGKAVTALYEINLRKRGGRWNSESESSGNLGRVFVRYKNPETNNIEEVSKEISHSVLYGRHTLCSPDFKLALASAEFAEIMRDSYWAKNSNLESVRQLAAEVYHQTRDEKVLELVNLISRARDLRSGESDYFSRE